MAFTGRLCELYIDTYNNDFFLKDGIVYSVLFHVIKSHLIKRINIYKDELMAVSWAPARIYFCYNKIDIDTYNEILNNGI